MQYRWLDLYDKTATEPGKIHLWTESTKIEKYDASTKPSLCICMMMSWKGNIFHVTGLCARNALVTGEFPAQKPVTRSFDVFFDLRLNKPLSKQLWGWWFEMPSHSLWRHCNGLWIKYAWKDDDLKISTTVYGDKFYINQWMTRTTRMAAFWGYSLAPHDYPILLSSSYWIPSSYMQSQSYKF